MLRPSRPWRSLLQARDLRDETPWAAPPPSCLPCSLPSLPPCVTAHHAPSLPRPRNRLVASGGERSPGSGGTPPCEHAQQCSDGGTSPVQSARAPTPSRERPGDPVRTRLL